MPLAVPVSLVQLWAFAGLSLVFFAFVLRAASRRGRETGAKQDHRSQLGNMLQAVGIGLAAVGPESATLAPFSAGAMLGTIAVVLLMGIAIALFAASSSALGRNWSIVARTRSDHELVRSGPYAYVRHPIYLGMLFFLLGLAVALGHWLQLVIAVPIFLTGTSIRARLEDALLEQTFGDEFRQYRRSTPGLVPRFF